KEEMEENPALEQGEEGHDDEFETQDEPEAQAEEEYERDGSEEDYENIDISEYVHDGDDEVGDYRMRDDNYPEQDDKRVIPHRVEVTFNELMLQQLGLLKIDDKQRKIAEHLIGSLDDDGYLRREIPAIIDDLAFRQNIDTTEEELGEILLM